VPNKPSIVELSQGNWHPWRMHSADNKLELIELTYRARDFLLLDVHENQKILSHPLRRVIQMLYFHLKIPMALHLFG